jgi:hypothetical protein
MKQKWLGREGCTETNTHVFDLDTDILLVYQNHDFGAVIVASGKDLCRYGMWKANRCIFGCKDVPEARHCPEQQ